MIFLLQHLGFATNLTMLDPVQEIEFLGLVMNSQTTTLSLPKKKYGDLLLPIKLNK